MKRFLAPCLLLVSFGLVGWTLFVDNFLGVPLTQATPTNGQIWKYNSTTGKYALGTDSGGAETLSISDLTDVGPMTEASGDLLYFDTAWTRLAKGSDGQVLKLASGLPSWAADAGGAETLASTDLTDFSTAKTGTGTSVVSNTGPTINTPTLVTPTITVTGTATTVLHGSVAGAASFSAVTASDADTTITDRLNPTPATVGNIPVDAGAATPYTFIDGSDADTTKALFATGAASAPAFRVLAGGDIDELLRLEELSDVATMTEAAGDMLVRNVGNTAWDRLDMTDADTTKALFSTGASSLPALRNLAQSDVDELLSISDLTDVGAITEAAGDLLVVVGTTWTNLAKGSNSTVLQVSSGGTLQYSTVTNAMLAGSITGDKISTVPDSVTNVTAATDLTITATGDEVAMGDQLKVFGTTSDPTNEQDFSYDTDEGVLQAAYDVGRVALSGTFFKVTTDSSAVSTSGSDSTFSNGTTSSVAPAAGNVIDYRFWGTYTSDGTAGTYTFKIKKGSTTLISIPMAMSNSQTGRSWQIEGSIIWRSTTSTEAEGRAYEGASTFAAQSYQFEQEAAAPSASSETLTVTVQHSTAGESTIMTGGWMKIH